MTDVDLAIVAYLVHHVRIGPPTGLAASADVLQGDVGRHGVPPTDDVDAERHDEIVVQDRHVHRATRGARELRARVPHAMDAPSRGVNHADRSMACCERRRVGASRRAGSVVEQEDRVGFAIRLAGEQPAHERLGHLPPILERDDGDGSPGHPRDGTRPC